MTHKEIVDWLQTSDSEVLKRLFAQANQCRRDHVGDAVHLRGLIEISNHCSRLCKYCGLRAPRKIERYRMSQKEILESARRAVHFGFGTVVLQAGEDFSLQAEWIAEVIRAIKAETSLAITLSLGERLPEELLRWREAGADRYLLRFETSDPVLYDAIHPRRGTLPSDRIAQLRQMRTMGYEIGSGVMVGIPGQTFDMLARDIEVFADLDLDMIGIGPFLAHPGTPLGAMADSNVGEEQVPANEIMALKTLALARIACPQANLPSTTALATINTTDGREHGLESGGNVFMPILTPAPYRQMYEIYPGRACVEEDATQCNLCLRGRIQHIGRFVGTGPGGRGMSSYVSSGVHAESQSLEPSSAPFRILTKEK